MAQVATKTRASLILRIRNPRDAEAWDTFVDLYGPFIYQICRESGLPADEAADTTQNVFVRLLGKIRTFEYQPEVGQFRGWLCRLTQNEIADAWRRLRRLRRAPGSDAVPEPPPVHWEDGAWEEAFGAYIHRLALDRVRARVGKRTWILFKLTWFVGCPPERVARRFGLPVGRVFEAKCRVLARFRQEARALAEEAAALVPVEPKGARGGAPHR